MIMPPPYPSHAMKRSPRFWFGLVLLVLGPPVTWGGIAACNAAAFHTANFVFVKAAVVIYVASWIAFLFGILLAGPDGVRHAKDWATKLTPRRRKPQAPRQEPLS